jgi:soluble cytochrome b562
MNSLNDPELAKHEKKLKEYQDGLRMLMSDIEKVVKRLQSHTSAD